MFTKDALSQCTWRAMTRYEHCRDAGLTPCGGGSRTQPPFLADGQEPRRCLIDVAQPAGLHASVVEGPDQLQSGQLTMLAHIRVGPLPLLSQLACAVRGSSGARNVCSPEAKGTTESLQALVEGKTKHRRATRDALTDALPKVHQLRHVGAGPNTAGLTCV